MKIFKYLLIFLAISTVSYAGKLDDYIKISQNGKVDITGNNLGKTLNIQDEVVKKLDGEIQKLQDNVTTKLDEEIQKLTGRVDGMITKGEKLVDNATNEYNDLVKTKNKVVSSVNGIIDNLPKYILIAKIIFSILALGIVSLAFFFLKNYKKLKGFPGSLLKLNNSEAIDNIDKRLNELEKKIDKLLSNSK